MLTVKWSNGGDLDIWETPHVTRISNDEVRFIAAGAAVTVTRPGTVAIYDRNGIEMESFSINGPLPRRPWRHEAYAI